MAGDGLSTLVDMQAKMISKIAGVLARRLRNIWSDFDGWYDSFEVDRVAAESVELVEQAQRQTRQVTRNYIKLLYQTMNLRFPTEDSVKAEIYPRQEVTPGEVWSRPAEYYRWQVSEGATREDAQQKALDRVEKIAEKEVQLAQRDQSARVYQKTEAILGYRRVIHPELSNTGTCGLCVAAADRVYRGDDLMPIHDGCNCTTAPMTRSHDPGLSLNREDLDRLYEAAGGTTSGGGLLNVRVQEYTSSELGPILTTRGKSPTGHKYQPRERANRAQGEAAEKARKPKSIEEQISDSERLIESMQRSLNGGSASLPGGEIQRKFLSMQIEKAQRKLDQLREVAA